MIRLRIQECEDLIDVTHNLVTLSAKNFEEELFNLSPILFGSFPQINFQNEFSIISSFSNRALQNCIETPLCCNTDDQRNDLAHISCDRPQSLWFNPIGSYFSQSDRDLMQVGFKSRNYGFNLGYDKLFDPGYRLGCAGSYIYSNIDWSESRGGGKIQSVFITPYIGYLFSKYTNIQAGLLLGRSFYSADRKLHFNAIRRSAAHDHKSWDVNAFLSGQSIQRLSEKLGKDLYITPQFQLSYGHIFEGSYAEQGANSIDLDVRSKYSSLLTFELKMQLFKEITTHYVCIKPGLQFGWIRRIPLGENTYTASFYKQVTCESHFTTSLYDKFTDQLLLGANLIVDRCQNWSADLSYEANLGDHSWMQQLTGRFNWFF